MPHGCHSIHVFTNRPPKNFGLLSNRLFEFLGLSTNGLFQATLGLPNRRLGLDRNSAPVGIGVSSNGSANAVGLSVLPCIRGTLSLLLLLSTQPLGVLVSARVEYQWGRSFSWRWLDSNLVSGMRCTNCGPRSNNVLRRRRRRRCGTSCRMFSLKRSFLFLFVNPHGRDKGNGRVFLVFRNGHNGSDGNRSG